jgi:DNA polymerase III epsilon subunit-like protein
MIEAKALFATWVKDGSILCLDTETTGLNDSDVPWSLGICDLTGKELLNLRFRPLNADGKIIPISDGAADATGVRTEDVENCPTLESDEVLPKLKTLLAANPTFTGYNTKFDRQMLDRALEHAAMRCIRLGDEERRNDVAAARKYIGTLGIWKEAKDLLLEAIGRDPQSSTGRKTRFEEIARITGCLAAGAKQAHGAIEDSKLLASVIRTLAAPSDGKPTLETKEEPEMSTDSPFTKAAAPVVEKTIPIPEMQERTITEQEKNLAIEMDGLRNTIRELRAEREKLSFEVAMRISNDEGSASLIKHLETENREQKSYIASLEAQLESPAPKTGQSESFPEARSIAWTDVVINGYQINVTAREGSTPQMIADTTFALLGGLTIIRQNDKVAQFSVVENVRGTPRMIKGGNGNGKAHQNGQGATADEPPDEEPQTTVIDGKDGQSAQSKKEELNRRRQEREAQPKDAGKPDEDTDPTIERRMNIACIEYHEKDKKPEYWLFEKKGFKFPVFKVSLDWQIKKLGDALEVLSVEPTAEKKETPGLICIWKYSEKTNSEGKRYRNVQDFDLAD